MLWPVPTITSTGVAKSVLVAVHHRRSKSGRYLIGYVRRGEHCESCGAPGEYDKSTDSTGHDGDASSVVCLSYVRLADTDVLTTARLAEVNK